MSEDICGSTDTSSGEPCQFSPGESCPWHDTKTPPKTGRKGFIDDEEAKQRALEAAEAGMYLKDCAAYAKYSYETLRTVLDKGEKHNSEHRETKFSVFSQEFDAREAEGIKKRLEEASPEHVLATKGYSEKREIEHSGDALTVSTEFGTLENGTDNA